MLANDAVIKLGFIGGCVVVGGIAAVIDGTVVVTGVAAANDEDVVINGVITETGGEEIGWF